MRGGHATLDSLLERLEGVEQHIKQTQGMREIVRTLVEHTLDLEYRLDRLENKQTNNDGEKELETG